MDATSSVPSLPTALVQPVIEEYTRAAKPFMLLILIKAIFVSLFVPFLVFMFAFSSRHTWQRPIFILNVLSICLNFTSGVIGIVEVMHQLIEPFSPAMVALTYGWLILFVWSPWFSEAVLILRVLTVFSSESRRRQALLLLFPITVKLVRVSFIILCIVEAHKVFSSPLLDIRAFGVTRKWEMKTIWSLELVDNAYMSTLFLYRLYSRSRIFKSESLGRLTGSPPNLYLERLTTLFWICSTNVVFPVIFDLSVLIVLCTSTDIITVANLAITNNYLSCVCVVFATVWSGTMSFREAHFDYSRSSSTRDDISFSPPVFRHPSDLAVEECQISRSGHYATSPQPPRTSIVEMNSLQDNFTFSSSKSWKDPS